MLTGTHQAERAPVSDGPRWAVGAILRPDPSAAQAIEQVARAAAAVTGANHWLAGASRSSHLSLRRHLEQRRRPIPADAAADDLAAAFDAALHAQGWHEAGSTPALWYVNLVYFTGPVRTAGELTAWIEARRQMPVTDVRVTQMQIARWQHTSTGMLPVVLASASLP